MPHIPWQEQGALVTNVGLGRLKHLSTQAGKEEAGGRRAGKNIFIMSSQVFVCPRCQAREGRDEGAARKILLSFLHERAIEKMVRSYGEVPSRPCHHRGG